MSLKGHMKSIGAKLRVSQKKMTNDLENYLPCNRGDERVSPFFGKGQALLNKSI